MERVYPSGSIFYPEVSDVLHLSTVEKFLINYMFVFEEGLQRSNIKYTLVTTHKSHSY